MNAPIALILQDYSFDITLKYTTKTKGKISLILHYITYIKIHDQNKGEIHYVKYIKIHDQNKGEIDYIKYIT